MAKLLIIEDDQDVIEMTNAYFSERNWEVLCAET